MSSVLVNQACAKTEGFNPHCTLPDWSISSEPMIPGTTTTASVLLGKTGSLRSIAPSQVRRSSHNLRHQSNDATAVIGRGAQTCIGTRTRFYIFYIASLDRIHDVGVTG